jgi:hypothetical protein
LPKTQQRLKQRAIATGILVTFVATLVSSDGGTLAGVMNALGWSPVVIDRLAIIGVGYFLSERSDFPDRMTIAAIAHNAGFVLILIASFVAPWLHQKPEAGLGWKSTRPEFFSVRIKSLSFNRAVFASTTRLSSQSGISIPMARNECSDQWSIRARALPADIHRLVTVSIPHHGLERLDRHSF